MQVRMVGKPGASKTSQIPTSVDGPGLNFVGGVGN